MTDSQISNLGWCIFIGLALNGCLSNIKPTPRFSIDERNIVDEQIIADAIIESGCLQSGRDYVMGICQDPKGK